MKALIFFDINGTIIERDSRTDLPYYLAVDKLLGIKNAMAGIDNSARSDQDVFREALVNHGVNYSDHLWQRFLKLYEAELDNFKRTDIWRKNVDVVPFIEELAQSKHALSLITGELKVGAQHKLQKIGVWQYFPNGGFGDDALTRFAIAEAALRRATAAYGDAFDDIYVIGDTLLDIKTARHIGAKVISITTGSNTRKELMALKPDYIIDRFAEVEALFIKEV
ncbi:MAG: hypothetical protein CSB19_02325 [Clostridiales bacterium]|nr:MAG: hypothetical protein CSB19_02325 [Clostridiales bacterium]